MILKGLNGSFSLIVSTVSVIDLSQLSHAATLPPIPRSVTGPRVVLAPLQLLSVSQRTPPHIVPRTGAAPMSSMPRDLPEQMLPAPRIQGGWWGSADGRAPPSLFPNFFCSALPAGVGCNTQLPQA